MIYVDDVVLADNDLSFINHVKHYLHAQFHIKDLGDLKYFLGFEVARSHQGLVLNQHKYFLDILSEFGLTTCKPINAPSSPTIKLNADTGELLDDPTEF